MNSHAEFLQHAAECESMAKFARDPDSKAVWSGMAQRWIRCAATIKSEELAVRSRKQAMLRRKGHARAL
jgi:hypothetical protein